MAETDDKAAESAGQGQTARICMLILPYTLRKINHWLQKARWG